MDDQHKHIKGYRDLSSEEVALMNGLKKKEAEAGSVLNELEAWVKRAGDTEAGRWISIARTHLETGFMYAIKAVARPTNGLGRRNPE